MSSPRAVSLVASNAGWLNPEFDGAADGVSEVGAFLSVKKPNAADQNDAFFGLADESAMDWSLDAEVVAGAVSYTHLTLPTNREV